MCWRAQWQSRVEVMPDAGEQELSELMPYLWARYAGVFDRRQMQQHIRDYIGFEIASEQVSQVVRTCGRGARILDVGSGWGSFVLVARKCGVDAIGIELSEFEVNFARRRLRQERPDDDPDSVYCLGNALELPFENESFDGVTLWNVLEHVPDSRKIDRVMIIKKTALGRSARIV